MLISNRWILNAWNSHEDASESNMAGVLIAIGKLGRFA